MIFKILPLSFIVILATSFEGVAAPEKESTETMAPLAIDWVGLPYKTPGKTFYPHHSSPIIQTFNKALNINLYPVQSDAFSIEEMNMLFATGNIPHHILSNRDYFLRYKNERLLRSIPIEMLKQHAPTYWRDYVNGIAAGIWFESPAWDTRTETLWAIPDGIAEIKHQLVARKDWLENIGAKTPVTIEEFTEVSRLFTFADPDGDGKNNTWALATSAKSPTNWINNLTAFLSAFGYEKIETPYLDPTTDQISFFETTEGFRDFLRWMNKMWNSGFIHPDLMLSNNLSVGSLFQDGSVGFAGDSWTHLLPSYKPNTWFSKLFKENPSAQVVYLDQLTAKDYRNTWQEQLPIWTFHTIGKDTSDEQLEKILNIIELQLSDPFFHNLTWSGLENQHFRFNEVTGVREFLPSFQNDEVQGKLGIKFFLTNIRYDWMLTASFGKEAEDMAKRQNQYTIIPPLLGHDWVLETQNRYRLNMSRIREDYVWKAITGIKNLDEDWTIYVEEWMDAGGRIVLEEARYQYVNLKKTQASPQQ